MFTLLGEGGLLSATAQILREKGIRIERVITSYSSTTRMRRLGFPVETYGDERTLQDSLFTNTKSVVLTVNYPAIISDRILSTGTVFYNIHNGDTRRYRGFSEICVVAAIVHREEWYGQTLQRILPGRKVDSGPLISRSAFRISQESNFEDIMSMSLENYVPFWCAEIENLKSLPLGNEESQDGSQCYSYASIESLVRTSQSNGTSPRLQLGRYSAYFPRLQQALEKFGATSP